jgi:uracil-DNA glycosylase family 4
MPALTTLAQSLDELKLQARDCQACGLASRRTNVVFGEGNPQAVLTLIGEGPGETEDLTGRPFVGRAGQMLDRALADNGLSREHVYICNLVKCRACDWNNGKAYNRAPVDAEISACSKWLVPQLRSISPKVILCVGGPSANTIIRKGFKITQERGKYFPCTYARTAVATLHPAYILRQQSTVHDGGYSLLVSDIAKAWTAAQRLLRMEQSGEIEPFKFGIPAGKNTSPLEREVGDSDLSGEPGGGSAAAVETQGNLF